jgi:hypothetical protein
VTLAMVDPEGKLTAAPEGRLVAQAHALAAP